MTENPERRQFRSPKDQFRSPNDQPADVLVELTRRTYHHLLPTALLTGVGLAGTTALLANRYRDVWLWTFTGLIAGLALLRAGLAGRYRDASRDAVTIAAARRWQMLNAGTTLASCLCFAICTFYCFRRLDPTAWTLCTLGTFMLCAGTAARVGIYPSMIQASGLALLASLALAMLLSADSLVHIGVLLIALFGVAYVQSVQNRFETTVDQIRSRRTLTMMANSDTLTGLSNRTHFEATLATTCEMGTPLAILFIGIDGLDAVNQAHGRAVCDVVRQRVGARLKSSVRREDVTARIGEDEFAVLQVANATQESAESLSRRIVRAVAAPFEIDALEIRVAATIWIRLAATGDRDARTLLDRDHGDLYPAPPPDLPRSTQEAERRTA